MPNVIHFEINADDTARAADFYSRVFGWKVMWARVAPEPYWIISTGDAETPSIRGGMKKRTDPKRSTVIQIDVTSLDDYAKLILSNGGKAASEKIRIQGTGYVQYFEDTEGNVFALLEKSP